MKYAIDKIEEGIVVLENIETGEIIELAKEKLPTEIHEGSIVCFENNIYVMDRQTELSKKESLRERLERLKNINN